ncbi:hypothetical protein BDN67DRAFT_961102 [Paxillus ammoniavirescens]|nr:hypothetical protein BDN67DRAFT_961102 [Paxillus ammoniavirescens]
MANLSLDDSEHDQNVATGHEPPPKMQVDNSSAVDGARRRLAPKSRFPLFSSLPNLRSKYSASKEKLKQRSETIERLSRSTVVLPQPDEDTRTIVLDYEHLPDMSDDEDVYRWAVLYENQRGITIFSTPFYSRLSLLPTDPQPFTIPSSNNTRGRQPNVSLTNYPLPDGTWRWVSKAWMIDMRTDLGEVQHDGFEYNWVFCEKHWHAGSGKLGAGAWVRRRRWVRLMMRPAKRKFDSESDHVGSSNGIFLRRNRSPLSAGPSMSIVSLVHPGSEITFEELEHEAAQAWEGSERDWQCVRRLLRHLGRDGRKLELWRMWLGPYARGLSDVKGKGKQSSPDVASSEQAFQGLSGVMPGNPPPLVHLATLLKNHGDAILQSFVFPDSRAQFIDLVKRAGLTGDAGHALTTSGLDFWSYSSGLETFLDKEDQEEKHREDNEKGSF